MKNPRESGDFFIEASTQKRWYKTIYLKFFAFFVIPVFAVAKKSVYHLPIAKVSFAFFVIPVFAVAKKSVYHLPITEVSFAYFSFQRKVG